MLLLNYFLSSSTQILMTEYYNITRLYIVGMSFLPYTYYIYLIKYIFVFPLCQYILETQSLTVL